MAAAQPPGPDVYEIEHELAQYRRGQSPGHAIFDLLFGIAAPLATLWADPGLFGALFLYDEPAALGPYWSLPAWGAAIVAAAALALWVLTGARRPLLGLLCVGPFAAGFLLAAGLSLELALVAPNLLPALTGFLGLTPWLTAYVLGRHAVRALRAGAEASVVAAALSLLVVTGVLLGAFGLTVKAQERQARLLTEQLLSRDAVEHSYALDAMMRTRAFDPEWIAEAYGRLPAADLRRERVAVAYEQLTGGDTIASALRRMGLADQAPPPPPIPSTATPPSSAPEPETDAPTDTAADPAT
jgi:hypothetical protein